jgi:hypothetical protein
MKSADGFAEDIRPVDLALLGKPRDFINSIVIPAARARRSGRDPSELSGGVAARRGVRPADRGGP